MISSLLTNSNSAASILSAGQKALNKDSTSGMKNALVRINHKLSRKPGHEKLAELNELKRGLESKLNHYPSPMAEAITNITYPSTPKSSNTPPTPHTHIATLRKAVSERSTFRASSLPPQKIKPQELATHITHPASTRPATEGTPGSGSTNIKQAGKKSLKEMSSTELNKQTSLLNKKKVEIAKEWTREYTYANPNQKNIDNFKYRVRQIDALLSQIAHLKQRNT